MQHQKRAKVGGRRRWTAVEKQQWLARYAVSGQTQARFCRAHGLAVPTFSAWRHRQSARRGELIEVPPPGGAAVTIQGADGLSVAVASGVEIDWVVRLVRALRCGG